MRYRWPAVNAQFPDGIREHEPVRLVSDNGCQPTSTNFMAACRVLGLKQIFTSFNNPKGNADTERVFRTMKEDLIWLEQWHTFDQLFSALQSWINDYNTDFPHSTINQLTPQQYEDQHQLAYTPKYSLLPA
jgi:putative transposase